MSIALRRKGIMFVISAPSGTGKSTVLHSLWNGTGNLAYSVSVTSRPPRLGEREGIDYYFVSAEDFQAMIARGEFYEWAEVHGNFYGTRKSVIEKILATGQDVVMDLDVQGARSIKAMKSDAVTIFLLPPSMAALEERLRGRETDLSEAIRLRLRNAAGEIAECNHFDYILINDILEQSVSEVVSIIIAERHRSSRQELLFEGEPALEPLTSK